MRRDGWLRVRDRPFNLVLHICSFSSLVGVARSWFFAVRSCRRTFASCTVLSSSRFYLFIFPFDLPTVMASVLVPVRRRARGVAQFPH